MNRIADGIVGVLPVGEFRPPARRRVVAVSCPGRGPGVAGGGEPGCMNARGKALRIVVMAALVCIGLWALMRAGAAAAYRDSGEVTAVVDGDRPGTVVVRTWRDGRADLWLADDTGEPVDWLDPSAPAGGAPQTRQCLGELCYRVPGGTLRVEQSTDGGATFATVWEVGGSRYTRLASAYPDLGDAGGTCRRCRWSCTRCRAGMSCSSPTAGTGCSTGTCAAPGTGTGCRTPAKDAASTTRRRASAATRNARTRPCRWAPPRPGPSCWSGWPSRCAGGGGGPAAGRGDGRGARRRRRGPVAPLGDVGMFPGYFYSGPIVLGIVVGGSIAVNALLVGPPAAAPTRPGPGM